MLAVSLQTQGGFVNFRLAAAIRQLRESPSLQNKTLLFSIKYELYLE